MTACPALLVAAPASGQGKTLVTAALARRHAREGRRVRVFKCGPDFLDPMILEAASGAPVHQLDLFMVGEAECRALLYEAVCEADLILVEGVMGLHDGDPSAADLARRFGLPVLAVVDGSSMAQTFGALVHGLATYRAGVNLAAVLANRVGSLRHSDLLEQSVPSDIRWLGALGRDAMIGLPERHLGLVQAGEVADLSARLDRAADLLPESALWLPEPVTFAAPVDMPPPPSLTGKRIAIARDEAFAFIYPANLAFLEKAGAQAVFFSPLTDAALPACDALWLPGGYPELHLERLAANAPMLASIRAHHAAGRPILAECGGMLYTCETLDDGKGTRAALLGLLPALATMQPRLAALGMQEAEIDGHPVRGHTFHYSTLETALSPVANAATPDGRPGERVFRRGSLTASYMHLYFPSGPELMAALFTDTALKPALKPG
ncbi:hydrogenobyrinic acid a,c-diamide synthase (glutamine-hydrolysing) /cobyrinate a,c-diamide synthase [Novosphingobium sp. PhB165]|uniref:cobyrinate a,c-diamide synthase n=1 Tax=Novosphingobium sp. PhB165 TaxID=2485105 RepID=UPI00105272E8|nr:cobyrinate a,c-diamide synthase [Novosphingobium sp. PhB165]TCM17678.1 hydrogenobyrinic acid a,c-diamide synthase (glutamine-hydrolysing) /cobyrinate a,c-diamide synthase [Novosphingobium sp. PhB165]